MGSTSNRWRNFLKISFFPETSSFEFLFSCVALFILVKFLFLVDAVVQIFMLIRLPQLWTRRSQEFVWCHRMRNDFQIREVTIVHLYSMQFVLLINLFKQKTFSLDDAEHRWFHRLANSSNKVLLSAEEEERLRAFLEDYLQSNGGCFPLRLLLRNGRDRLVHDVILRLFENFHQSRLNVIESISSVNIDNQLETSVWILIFT